MSDREEFISKLDNLIRMQTDEVKLKRDEYGRGLVNGLLLSKSILMKEVPKFIYIPNDPLLDIKELFKECEYIDLKASNFLRSKLGLISSETTEEKETAFAHCLKVEEIISDLTDDIDLIRAALLHDAIENGYATYEEIKEKFGKRAADFVMEVTGRHNKILNKNKQYFPLLKSKEAIMIKFADRLHNLTLVRTLEKETQETYLEQSKFW